MAVVAEFYPSRRDPVLGVWAHRQALAAVHAGAELRVLVLHRLVPPRRAFAAGGGGSVKALRELASQPLTEARDGLEITYVPYVSPPRERHYAGWGSWAAPALSVALARLRRKFPYELLHAHNAVPSADALRRAGLHVPMVVSVHGGDVLYTARRGAAAADAVRASLSSARLVLANSRGIAELSRAAGAGETRVVHLGTDLPAQARAPAGTPLLVSAAHLVARKRHTDVLRAVAVLAPRHPQLRYEIIGDGPERIPLEGLAARLGISARVSFLGQLAPDQALARLRDATLFVLPSIDEAFGVVYIEAMAGGVPAIGCRGEPGPEEIAAAGDGFLLVPPGDVERLSQRIDELLSDPHRLREAGQRARATVAEHFTWEGCGERTVAAYRDALA